MKITLILTLSLIAAALLFPIRTGVVTQSYGVVEVPMGPYFVASAPSSLDVCEEFYGKKFDDSAKLTTRQRATSHVDYGRTILFAGGIATLGLLAALIIGTRNSALCNAASLPSASDRLAKRRERMA